MKQGKSFGFTALIALLTIVSLLLVAGTYAKYTSTASGSDSATVAKWSIKVNDTDIASTTPQTVEFDIFSTIKDTKDQTDYTSGSDDTDVRNETKDSSKTIIAPGTYGDFQFSIKNESDVTAEYKVDYDIVNGENIPLEFTTTPSDDDSWKPSIDSIDEGEFTKLDMDGAETQTTKVYWRWKFNGDDNKDTSLGTKTELPTVTVTAKVDVQQVD